MNNKAIQNELKILRDRAAVRLKEALQAAADARRELETLDRMVKS